MNLQLKLSFNQRQEIKGLEEIYNALLSNPNPVTGKISTKKLEIELDKKDNRNISSLRKIELVIKLKEGFLVLKGNLGCSFKPPFGGEFYIIDYKEIPNGNFETQGGVNVNITINNSYPIDINSMSMMLRMISEDPEFVFNIEQFDEFMEVFTFYKKLSDEINNSATYDILTRTNPYYYLSIDVKELYDEKSDLLPIYHDLEPIYDGEEIIKGYKVPEHIYDRFTNDLKDKTISLVDLTIENAEDIVRRIQRMSENLYVSDHKIINDNNSKDIRGVELLNVSKNKNMLILSVMEEKPINERYLNLYDMGQKIKIESIENSLKLINRGTTEASMPMIEYLIGDKTMPNANISVRNNEEYIKIVQKMYLKAAPYIESLNVSQKVAFFKSIDGSPVTLIKGPPGTGKTHVINAITQYITKELKEKVVISSQTHVAIDNVLDKLMENHDLVIPNRITNRRNKYSIEEIDKTLYKTWGSKLINNLRNYKDDKLANKVINHLNNFKGIGEIQYSKNMKEEFDVIGATTTTSAISGKKGLEVLKGYKWLIIDEVSKSPITEVLRYLPYVEKIILVGDDFQLAPLLEFKKEDVKHLPSYDDDMFEKLETLYEQSVFSKTIRKADKSGRLILLDENYRSVKTVLDAYNIFYKGTLKNRRESIDPNIVQFNSESILRNDKNVFFIEALGATEQDDLKSHSRFNIQEAKATALILEDILKTVESPQTVTASAIFPYAAQISYFTKQYKDLINRAKKTLKSFELDTVDAFQGRETDIVLVNTVVTRQDKKSFLRDFRRINVSMSRARDKLIVFGSRTLERMEMESPEGGSQQYFRNIIDGIRQNGELIQIDQNGGVIKHDSKFASKFA
ncbi:DEAD/DEAH box helicase [Acholeplasma laidlawii]|uniref:DEAD/DEAH box helicase n=1 Tax=Acholeplasma laidlawii TaxID=2148 RepID=UPI0021F6BFE1|nr:AAA domain-containing protein [Acholeplasma laidlawii]